MLLVTFSVCPRAALMKNPTRTMTDTTLATAHVGVSTNDFPSSASIFHQNLTKTMNQSSKSCPFHVQEQYQVGNFLKNFGQIKMKIKKLRLK
ncbi:hypothetical protein Hanom_Chr15g01370601 [Helianthus anomalus]